jgi:D-xylose transport system ATP-binding protein
MALDEATMEQMAAETLAGLSVRGLASVRQRVASLSGGQRQTVAIAKAVLWNSKVVVLDEPTAALGVAQTAQVLELVRRLADSGLAVLLVSHNMNDVFAVADRIAVLYLGRMTAQVRACDVTHSQVVELITTGRGGTLRDAAEPRDLPADRPAPLAGPPKRPGAPPDPRPGQPADPPTADDHTGDRQNGAQS